MALTKIKFDDLVHKSVTCGAGHLEITFNLVENYSDKFLIFKRNGEPVATMGGVEQIKEQMRSLTHLRLEELKGAAA